MRLSHPLIAARSCDECRKWVWNADGTRCTQINADFVPVPVPLLPGMKTPCVSCPKIPEGVPLRQRTIELGRKHELSPRNRRAIQHYLECKAVGSFPDDPIVRRNAALLRSVEDAHAAAERRQLVEVVMVALQVKRMGD